MNFQRIDEFLDKMPDRAFPACEFAVSKDGKIIYRRGVGYADGEGKRPVSDKDIYWIFSATKVITCIAAMQLVEQGNTVIVIEHNLDVLKSVDYLFDMGPEGGKKGGMIVAQGTPEQLAENPDSVTGPFLKEIL